jgi:hypothetical protein
VRTCSCSRFARPFTLAYDCSLALIRALPYDQWSSPRTPLAVVFWCALLAVEAAAFAPAVPPLVRKAARAAERARSGPQAALSLRMVSLTDRVFTPDRAQGGCEIHPDSTALVMIEYQNEFCAEGGKLHDAVKNVMAR